MSFFGVYRKARINIERRFKGLQYAHTLLIKSLMTLADPLTGIVTNITYSDISALLKVSKTPGRIESGAPQKQIVRNASITIEREFNDYFKVISEGQSLKFFFPEMPKIFSKLFNKAENGSAS
ncbi:hypothetical protein J2N86_15550 (plasmid) [Legionella lytica]|uniref:Uncharacterized protein n=1 Tax=Legionella lytica TaxID=96232 RepID=A0ABY4YEL1_9GAMM|nr:hypothetical protein [Legionella lytica]USQ15562.1 hypothetical protein J2N86_15550 [Legionella lytica]